MTANRTSPPAAPAGAKAVDLAALERQMRQGSGRDLTEAKEAIVEGLVQLTLQRCSGAGPEGEFVFGGKPSSRLVSGFLMPRYDSGLDDETSDIRIATMGIDLQLASETSGEVIVKPELAIYVRALPTWEELIDPRHDMAPQVQLARETRRQVEDLASLVTTISPWQSSVAPMERLG